MRILSSFFAGLLIWGCAHNPLAAAQPDSCAGLERRFEAEKPALAAPQISSLLFTASDNGCDALAGRLLQTGASVAAQDRVGGTALTHAARNGQTAIIRILLDKGAQINHRMIDGSTPLFTAIEKDRTEAANLLAANGADVTIAGRNGVTPLAAAAFNRNEKIVAVLLAHGADPNAADSTGKPPIVYAAHPAVDPSQDSNLGMAESKSTALPLGSGVFIIYLWTFNSQVNQFIKVSYVLQFPARHCRAMQSGLWLCDPRVYDVKRSGSSRTLDNDSHIDPTLAHNVDLHAHRVF